MKKIIYACGVLFLSIVIILNILFTANLDASEHITINLNNIVYILGLIICGIIIFVFTRFINEKKIRKKLLIAILLIYILFTIIWTATIKTPIVGDSGVVCDLAQVFYIGNIEEATNRITYAGISLAQYMRAVIINKYQ